MSDYLSEDINDICFIDTETLSGADLKASGMYVYSEDPAYRVMIVTYAIGDGPVRRWSQNTAHLGDWLDWHSAPHDLQRHLMRVADGRAWFVAWNAGFDRLSLSRGMTGYAQRPEHFLDAMVQATRSHLPPDLASAGRILKAPTQKRPEGKRLIQLFCVPPFADPADHPDEWAAFCGYAEDDIPPMRTIWKGTLPLLKMEWQQYWASEAINDRGMPVDVEFATAASAMAEENASRANADVVRISKGAIATVNQNAVMCDWVLARVEHEPDAAAILLREVVEEQEEEGDGIVRLEKHSMERSRVEDLIAFLERLDAEEGMTDEEFEAYQMLQVRLFGASATPRKFTKLLGMVSSGDRLRGQYVFAGAAATGRYSSRGLQIHNLTRATVGDQKTELAVIDQILGGASYEQLAERGPVGRTLSRLIRPVFVAPEGQRLVWGDWSAIEARVLPWLGEAYGGGRMLDVFLDNDADPALPDIYKQQAGLILGKPPADVSKAERQSHGKVPVLSLGFGGGKGALFAMARNYGASFTETEAGDIVHGWRAGNTWAVAYWEDTWEAVLWCMHNPGMPRAVGTRLTYIFLPDYMQGTLVCVLPDGRPLLYPVLKWEERERKDKMTGKVEVKTQLTYRRGYGRAALWYGTLVENAVQAVAGSLLRQALYALGQSHPQYVVGHVHDEILCMCDTADVAAMRDVLRDAMLALPEWADGLPMACEISDSFYYTKTID